MAEEEVEELFITVLLLQELVVLEVVVMEQDNYLLKVQEIQVHLTLVVEEVVA